MTPRLALSLAVALAGSAARAQTPPQAAPATTPAATTPPAEELPADGAVILSDEAAEGTSVRRGVSRFIVRAPLADVTRTMTDFGNYTAILPRVSESRVVRRTRAGTEVYMQVRLGSNFGVLWSRLRLAVRRSPERVDIEGTSLEGNVDRFELSSRLEAVPGDPGRTLVTCRMLTVPQLPLPSTVFTRENRDALATLANHLRARVETPAPAAAAPPPPAPAAPAAPPATAAVETPRPS